MRLPAILVALSLLSACAMSVAPAEGPTLTRLRASGSEASGLGAALNDFRAQNGLGPLRQDPSLARAAQAFAEDMAAHGYFSHTGRDGSTLLTRARAAGCASGGAMAENIAWGQPSARQAFAGWSGSAGHRRNMLGRSYATFGLGQSNGCWVLMLADRC
jgi:uncharacterized protein YkwD